MFKRIALALFAGALTLTPATIQAQETQSKLYMIRTLCDPIPKIAEVFKKYNEQLLFTGDFMTFAAQSGQPFQGGMLFYVNQDTGTFTVIQMFRDGTGCVMGNGRNFEPYTGPQIKPKSKGIPN
jgi:hypothetical protein